MSDTPWLFVDEIAVYLGVGKEPIYAWMEKCDFLAYRVDRFWNFQKNDIDNWVKSCNATDGSKNRDENF